MFYFDFMKIMKFQFFIFIKSVTLLFLFTLSVFLSQKIILFLFPNLFIYFIYILFFLQNFGWRRNPKHAASQLNLHVHQHLGNKIEIKRRIQMSGFFFSNANSNLCNVGKCNVNFGKLEVKHVDLIWFT